MVLVPSARTLSRPKRPWHENQALYPNSGKQYYQSSFLPNHYAGLLFLNLPGRKGEISFVWQCSNKSCFYESSQLELLHPVYLFLPSNMLQLTSRQANGFRWLPYSKVTGKVSIIRPKSPKLFEWRPEKLEWLPSNGDSWDNEDSNPSSPYSDA